MLEMLMIMRKVDINGIQRYYTDDRPKEPLSIRQLAALTKSLGRFISSPFVGRAAAFKIFQLHFSKPSHLPSHNYSSQMYMSSPSLFSLLLWWHFLFLFLFTLPSWSIRWTICWSYYVRAYLFRRLFLRHNSFS